jgi:hypothetical protein
MDNKKYREVYENLPENEKEMINEIWQVVNQHCKDEGIKIAYDDRAEYFIGAITGYLVESEVTKV